MSAVDTPVRGAGAGPGPRPRAVPPGVRPGGGATVLSGAGGLASFVLSAAGLPASAYVGYLAVKGPLAGRLAEVSSEVAAAKVDQEWLVAMPYAVGFLVALAAWPCWRSLVAIVEAPFRVVRSPRLGGLVGLMLKPPLGIFFVWMGWALVSQARHLVAGVGGHDTVAAWVACARGLSTLDVDGRPVLPAVLVVVGWFFVQSGWTSFASIPGAAARLASRRPRGIRAGDASEASRRE